MSVERKIKNTGELREIAAEVLVGVLNGSIQPETARLAHKMTHVINDNMFAEAKIMALHISLQHQVKKFGLMEITADNVVAMSKAA